MVGRACTAALIACAIGTTAGAQQSWSPNWTHVPQGTENWSPKNVTVGNRGSLALAQFGPVSDFVRLFAATDEGTPVAAWQGDTGARTYNHRVASAEYDDVFATLHDQDSPTQGLRNLVLRKFTSSSSAPDWTFTLPFTTNNHEYFQVMVSRDGSRIVAAALNIWNSVNTDVFVFGSDSSTPVASYSVDTFGLMRNATMSGDGSTLYITTTTGLQIVDLATGANLLRRSISGQAFEAQGISYDGRYIAYGILNGVRVLERNAAGDGYDDKLTHQVTGTVYCNKLAISDDGSVLACAFDDYSTTLAVRVQALALPDSIEQGSAVVTLDATIQGGGTFSNVTSAVETSASGKVIAVGLWGDEAGLAPEVVVYENGDNTPVRTYDLPGSVRALDLSGDGRHLGVASKGVHNNTFGGGGRIDFFDITSGDFTMTGVPTSTATVHFEHQGTPFMPAMLLVSGLESTTVPFFPGIGTLYVDRPTLTTRPMPSAGADGIATLDFQIPNAMVGQTLYFQGLNLAPRVLSEDWYKVTVLP